MKKYIAIQQLPEHFDFDIFADDDGIRSAGGVNCEVFVIGDGGSCYFNKTDYETICNEMDTLMEEFNDLTDMIDNGYSRTDIEENSYYHSYKDIINDVLRDERYRKYSPLLVKKLKTFAENYDYRELKQVAEFLTITTGMEWICEEYRGYSQGDYCYLIYCADIHTKEYMDLIGNGAVGAVTEFCISENPIEMVEDNENRDIDEIIEEAEADCCYGFYLIDHDVWNEEKCKEELAELAECELDEIAVVTIENSYTVTQHNYKVA